MSIPASLFVLVCNTPDDFARISNSNRIIRNIFDDYAAGANDHIAAYCHTRQYMDAATDPDIIANSDRIGVFKPGISSIRVNGVSGSVKAAVGSYEHVIAEYDFARIEYDSVVIGKKVIADLDVIAIVTP